MQVKISAVTVRKVHDTLTEELKQEIEEGALEIKLTGDSQSCQSSQPKF